LTEGPKRRIETSLHGHSISTLVDIVVSAEKTAAIYTRVAKLRPAHARWSIGDQPEKDIVPALAAGYSAIYFTGGFRSSWQTSPDCASVWVVKTYDKAVHIALGAANTSPDKYESGF